MSQQKTEGKSAPSTTDTFREYFEALLIAALFLGFTNTFLVKTFYIPSESMESTLLVGDHLFVNRFIFGPAASNHSLTPARDIARGDIVIFRSPESPETDLVKRCIGIPGDEVRIVDKRVYLNGERVADDAFTIRSDRQTYPSSRFLDRQRRLRDNFGPFVVPEGHYFFLGDNRDKSYDSRYWGAVPRHLIKGRALLIYWSFDGETPDGTWRGWRVKIAQVARTATGFFTETRWRRSFTLIR